ncbi:MAG TPA: hypothetical protein VF855_09945 [Acidimicrobiales bacterium]
MVVAVGTNAILTTLAALIVIPVIVGILSAIIFKRLVMKIISVAICAALFIILWVQRQEIADCAQQVKDAVEAEGLDARAECTFLWWELKVNLPDEV